MKTISIEVEDSLFSQVLKKFQEVLKKENIQSDFSFIDEVSDKIVLKNGVRFVVPTKKDLDNFNEISKTPHQK